MLMALIAIGGIFACAVALHHILLEKALQSDDALLGSIGVFLIVLGLFQTIKLVRQPN